MVNNLLDFLTLLLFRVIIILALAMILCIAPQQAEAAGIRLSGDAEGLELEADTPLFDMKNMRPGKVDEASVTLINNSENNLSYSFSTQFEGGDRILLQGLEMEVSGTDGTSYFEGSMHELYDVNITTLPAGSEQELNLKVRFPEAAGQKYQGKTVLVDFVFGAQQERTPAPPVAPEPAVAPEREMPEFFEIIGVPMPEKGGTVKGGGSFAPREEVKLEARAFPGYKFIYWREDESALVSRDEKYKFQAKRDRRLIAQFWEVQDHTIIKEIELDEQGHGKVFLNGVILKIFGAEPLSVGVVSLTPCAEGVGTPPASSYPAGICYSLQFSENLQGARAELYQDYQDALAPPEEFTEADLMLFYWNEALDKWDLSGISEQEVVSDAGDFANRQSLLRVEMEELKPGRYCLFYSKYVDPLSVAPVMGFLVENLLWLGLGALLLGIAGGVGYMFWGRSQINGDTGKKR